jgi:hypothetical protein
MAVTMSRVPSRVARLRTGHAWAARRCARCTSRRDTRESPGPRQGIKPSAARGPARRAPGRDPRRLLTVPNTVRAPTLQVERRFWRGAAPRQEQAAWGIQALACRSPIHRKQRRTERPRAATPNARNAASCRPLEDHWPYTPGRESALSPPWLNQSRRDVVARGSIGVLDDANAVHSWRTNPQPQLETLMASSTPGSSSLAGRWRS